MKEQTSSTGGRPFTSFLNDLRGGKTQDELSRQLREVVNAVMQTGKKGTVQLTVDIVPDKAIDDSFQVFVNDKIKITLPQADRASSVFFITEECDLSRKDPRQLSLDELKEVV